MPNYPKLHIIADDPVTSSAQADPEDPNMLTETLSKRCGARPWSTVVKETFAREWLASGKTESIFCHLCLTPVVERRLQDLRTVIAQKERELAQLEAEPQGGATARGS